MFFLMSYLLDAIQLPVPAFDHPFPCTIMYCTWFLFFGSAAAGLLMLVLGGITSVQLIVLILALSSDQHGDGNGGIGNTTCDDMCDSLRGYNMDE